MTWTQVWKSVKDIDPHYGMNTEQYRTIYDTAMMLPDEPEIVELGVCHGLTAYILATVAQEKKGWYTGIDDYSLEGSAEEVFARFTERGLENITLLSLSTRAASSYFNSSDFPFEADLLLIDAGHDEVNVSFDCEFYVPLVKVGGYVIFDDYPSINISDSPTPDEMAADAHWAVQYYGDKATPGRDWELITRVGGLVVKRRLR